jgi:zinc protease
LNILGEVFSERLRERIREKLGATYSPFAFNRPSRTYPGYGVLFTFIHVDPKAVDTVIMEVKALAATLARSGVTQDELQRVLKPTLTGLKDMLRRNGYWLNTVLSQSKKYPQQLNWNRSIMDDYAAITPEDVSHLAKKYLVNEKAAVIVIIPGEKPS